MGQTHEDNRKSARGDEDLRRQLETALAECARLREENTRLKALLGHRSVTRPTTPLLASGGREPDAVCPVPPARASDRQIALFHSLFRGREDVYAVRWEARDGRTGYSPVCRREWEQGVCGKPRVKCAECEYREFVPITDQVITDHLVGRRTIGVYPLLPDETCWFLAIDFDKSSWREDCDTFRRTCEEMCVPVSIERSRSGNGAHLWIFFDCLVPAHLARKLGCALLTTTMERRHQVGLESYDRLFPNQDTMPKGGFGNLIALPLQRGPSLKGNTLFLDNDFRPYSDQWEYLSTIRRMRLEEIEAVVKETARRGSIMGVRISLAEEDGGEDPWTLPPSKQTRQDPIKGPLPERVRLAYSNLVYVEKEGLPPALLNRLVRLAAFQNPEFYKAQAMRLPVFGIPRVISCAEDFPRHIGLPRGCLDDVLDLFNTCGGHVEVEDKRFYGRPIEVAFRGVLRPSQQEAAGAMLSHDMGILCAGTAFGKTVVGAWLIAARKVNTLVLVHRRHLLDQWRERLIEFLDVPGESIGEIGGGKWKIAGLIDIGLIQSLNRKGRVADLVAEYGQVIVDECHHLSAFSFEQVLKQVKARHIVGLTATPTRRDGHHPIVVMQCGPIRFRQNPREQAASMPFDHVVVVRKTEFRLAAGAVEPGIQEVYAALAVDTRRNDLILSDILAALEAGRSPLVLTERADHVEFFAERLRPLIRNVIVLRGGMRAKQRRVIAEQISAIADGEERVIIATGRYIGEGFDDARLDTLFLAMPVAWRGTLQQYAGRLHRLHHDKDAVHIYDYVDVHVPVLARMYKKRLKGYKALGYSVGQSAGEEEGLV